MAKKSLKQYTAVATVFYTREASASYTIMAEDDASALESMRELLKGRGAITEADDFNDIDNPFNVSGNFTMARGDDLPDDEDDESVIALNESFGE